MIKNPNSGLVKRRKNWYISVSDYVITVNAYSYTVITAHITQNK